MLLFIVSRFPFILVTTTSQTFALLSLLFLQRRFCNLYTPFLKQLPMLIHRQRVWLTRRHRETASRQYTCYYIEKPGQTNMNPRPSTRSTIRVPPVSFTAFFNLLNRLGRVCGSNMRSVYTSAGRVGKRGNSMFLSHGVRVCVCGVGDHHVGDRRERANHAITKESVWTVQRGWNAHVRIFFQLCGVRP
jgi:hypothetical protein